MNGKTNEEIIRAYLKTTREPMTTKEISVALGIKQPVALKCLQRMPDAWIDSWITGHVGRPSSLWRVMPDDAPPPPKKDR